jgi:hypothetical protein
MDMVPFPSGCSDDDDVMMMLLGEEYMNDVSCLFL